MKGLSKFASWGLVAIIALNIAGTAWYLVLQRQMRAARPQPSLATGQEFPRFSGTDVRGVKWQASAAPCRLIRIADDHCAYCEKDKPSYEKLLDAARHASCEIIEMAPQAGGMAYDPRPGVIQLKFVDADLGSVLFPFVTPQTVILDRNWSVKMTRRGIFDAPSLANAVALLGSLGSSTGLR